ncbi:hypothetical protein QUA74_05980 [Microcoleus sp. LAD1_D3]
MVLTFETILSQAVRSIDLLYQFPLHRNDITALSKPTMPFIKPSRNLFDKLSQRDL